MYCNMRRGCSIHITILQKNPYKYKAHTNVSCTMYFCLIINVLFLKLWESHQSRTYLKLPPAHFLSSTIYQCRFLVPSSTLSQYISIDCFLFKKFSLHTLPSGFQNGKYWYGISWSVSRRIEKCNVGFTSHAFLISKIEEKLDLVHHQSHLVCVIVFPPFVHARIHCSAILVLWT